MKLDVKYYAVNDLKKVVATTQRTASVSMIQALGPMQAGSKTQKIDVGQVMFCQRLDWPVLLWIRHPLDRIASAYPIFGQYGTFEDFVRRILKETNPHWSPVTKLHSLGKVFLPTHVYPFESLAETWADELPGYALEHWDETKQLKRWHELSENLSIPLQQQLINLFHEDFALHRWALENGVHEVAA